MYLHLSVLHNRLGPDTINITSVTWNPHDPLQLCCGLADGTIAMWDLDPTFRHPPTPNNPTGKSSSSSTSSSGAGACAGSNLMSSTVNAVTLAKSREKEKGNRNDVTLPSACDTGPRSGISTDYLSNSTAWEPCKDRKFALPHPSTWLADHNTDFSIAPRSALKSVSYCPYNPHLLMTSGYESAIKVCHLSSVALNECINIGHIYILELMYLMDYFIAIF